jgi:hypothetical protein
MRATWPRWATLLAASLGIAALAALYFAGLRVALDTSKPGPDFDANERDAAYALVHGAALFFALLVGFSLGKLSTSRGLAWAALFGGVMVFLMAGTLVGSRELACTADVNDLVRHWDCPGATPQ